MIVIYEIAVVALIVVAIAIIVGIAAVCHNRVVKSEEELLRKNYYVKQARRHNYRPLDIEINLESMAKYNKFNMDDEVIRMIDKDISKIQHRVDAVMWWLDYLETTYRREVNNISKSLKSKSAKRLLQETIPADLSIIRVTKRYNVKGASTKETKVYTLGDIDRLMKSAVEQEGSLERFTATSPKIRYAVLKRDDFTCKCCGRTGVDVDLHVMPIDETKGLTEENLTTVCESCYFERIGDNHETAEPTR